MTERRRPQRPRPVDTSAAQEIKDLLGSTGMTQKDVAAYLTRRLGDQYSHYHVSRMQSGGRRVTSLEMDALRELVSTPRLDEPGESPVPLTDTTDSVPLYGYANAAGATLRLNEDQTMGVVPTHPAQRGSRGAFAFVVFGDSMADRMHHGDIAYAVRNMLPLKDKPVLIELRSGEAVVKMFDGMDEATLFVRQLNPAKKLTYPLRDVAGLHRVVGLTL